LPTGIDYFCKFANSVTAIVSEHYDTSNVKKIKNFSLKKKKFKSCSGLAFDEFDVKLMCSKVHSENVIIMFELVEDYHKGNVHKPFVREFHSALKNLYVGDIKNLLNLDVGQMIQQGQSFLQKHQLYIKNVIFSNYTPQKTYMDSKNMVFNVIFPFNHFSEDIVDDLALHLINTLENEEYRDKGSIIIRNSEKNNEMDCIFICEPKANISPIIERLKKTYNTKCKGFNTYATITLPCTFDFGFV